MASASASGMTAAAGTPESEVTGGWREAWELLMAQSEETPDAQIESPKSADGRPNLFRDVSASERDEQTELEGDERRLEDEEAEGHQHPEHEREDGECGTEAERAER
jgi:hypothetical protein